ncbi:hypothetical protein B6K89_06645 [Bacillus subtilis]|nr:hypothetical protein B6K89_06645 [Bacillus subtilis]TWG74725.1 hypothetical protein L604_000600002020 [Bacillus subtilis J27]
MTLWSFFFINAVLCKTTLDTTNSNAFHGTIVKTCPSHHYQKEFHQTLETFIEPAKCHNINKKPTSDESFNLSFYPLTYIKGALTKF